MSTCHRSPWLLLPESPDIHLYTQSWCATIHYYSGLMQQRTSAQELSSFSNNPHSYWCLNSVQIKWNTVTSPTFPFNDRIRITIETHVHRKEACCSTSDRVEQHSGIAAPTIKSITRRHSVKNGENWCKRVAYPNTSKRKKSRIDSPSTWYENHESIGRITNCPKLGHFEFQTSNTVAKAILAWWDCRVHGWDSRLNINGTFAFTGATIHR